MEQFVAVPFVEDSSVFKGDDLHPNEAGQECGIRQDRVDLTVEFVKRASAGIRRGWLSRRGDG